MTLRLRPLRAALAAFLLLATACGEDADGGSTCTADTCVTPPARLCDGDNAISFTAFGECRNDACYYEPRTTACASAGQVCEAGACVDPPDPCAGVTCDEPPEPRCDGNVLVGASAAGACEGGDCSYGETRTDCALRGQICSEGACVAVVDPCEDVDCETAPANACEDDEVVVYRSGGTCVDGACEYDVRQRIDCAADGRFCAAGACVDGNPCEGVTCAAPPAPRCDGGVRVVSSLPGTCDGGLCGYVEQRTDCAAEGAACVDGACVAPDACVGVTCDRPPRDICDGDTARTFAQLGICDEGACAYDETRVDCAAGGQVCRSGACEDAPACDEASCTVPPNNECRGDVLVRYRLPGECDGTLCAYPTESEDCAATGRTCIDGACEEVVSICEDVICDSPPARRCVGSQAFVYEDIGICEGGECIYGFASITNCAERGAECVEGLCTDPDPCDDVDCSAPAAGCEGDVLVEFTGAGVCDDGECDFSAQRVETECAIANRRCVVDRCVPLGELLSASELLVSEVRLAADGSLEFVEIHEPLGSELVLDGLRIERGGRTYVVPAGVTIPANGWLSVGPDARFTLQWSAGFGDPVSGVDELALVGAERVGGVALSDVPVRGSAFQWDPPSFDTSSPEDLSLWCISPAGASGTPGLPNPPCDR